MLLWEFFEGTPERVRNSRGKRAINVRAIEVLLYSSIRNLIVHVFIFTLCITFNKEYTMHEKIYI